MSSHFSDKQIKAYANAFELGDAIFIHNQWCGLKNSTTILKRKILIPVVEDETIPIYGIKDNRNGITMGFKRSKIIYYRITISRYYEPKENDKLIWLGETNLHFTLGNAYYPVEIHYNEKYFISGFVLLDDKGKRIATYEISNWGIIPKWENVKPEKNLKQIVVHKKILK